MLKSSVHTHIYFVDSSTNLDAFNRWSYLCSKLWGWYSTWNGFETNLIKCGFDPDNGIPGTEFKTYSTLNDLICTVWKKTESNSSFNYDNVDKKATKRIQIWMTKSNFKVYTMKKTSSTIEMSPSTIDTSGKKRNNLSTYTIMKVRNT